MSGSRRRSSRRRSSGAIEYSRSSRGSGFGLSEIGTVVGVALVSVAAIVLIWIVTNRNIEEQRAELTERVGRTMLTHALTLSEETALEFQTIDQSLNLLQQMWDTDQVNFDLPTLAKKLPALTMVSKDVFIADQGQMVKQSIQPQATGQGVAGAYLSLPRGSLEILNREGQPLQSGQLLFKEEGKTIETRRYLVYVVRLLTRPTGWLLGALYRSDQFVRLYSQSELGVNGVVALLDSRRGILQSIAGPSARRPLSDIGSSEMMAAFQGKANGVWVGPTAMDNVVRITGFAKVAGRDMYVVVGMLLTEAMQPIQKTASGAWWVGFSGSCVVGLVAIAIIWGILTARSARRRARTYERGQQELTSLQAEVGSIRARSALNSGQLAATLRNAGNGLALLDLDLRLLAWNALFAESCGVANVLREGLPIDEFLRQQAHQGMFGRYDPNDNEAIETEVARRIAILRTEQKGGMLTMADIQGNMLAMVIDTVPDGGGLILSVGGSGL